jgi:hypothetical protein
MYSIENLELIWSVDLKRNIILLKEEVYNFMSQNWNDTDLIKKVNGLLYYHVLGVGRPICICDGACKMGGNVTSQNIWAEWGYDDIGENDYKIYLAIDYKVTSGYQPYQDLERPMKLSFLVNKSQIREDKINQLLS